MKIAIGPLLGEYGGTNQHIINVIKHSKYRLKAITPSPFSIYYSDNKVKKLGQSFLRACRIQRADLYGLYLSKVLASRFDIVHFHGDPIFWPEIYRKPKNRRAKYIQTVHGVLQKKEEFVKDWSLEDWRFKGRQYAQLLKSCRESDMVISVAKWLQEPLLEQHIESVHIAHGVSLKEFEASNPTRFRKKYHIDEDFFLFAAGIHKYKRPELFVELARRMPDKLFVMIGSNATLKTLRAYLKTEVPKNIVCLGLVPRRDVIDAFAACKVFVLPSRNEVFGIVVLEAMACKKPVVAADNAGPKEVVTHGRDGFLFEPDDLNDLYEKSCMAWEHPELGDKGYKKVKEKFDWPVVIRQVDQVYEELVEAG